MSKQQVPWAAGRRALLWSPDGWNEGEALLCDVHGECYQAWELLFDTSTGEPIEAIYAKTTLLPNQCPGCFAADCADSADGHEEGCRVAENLTRGVPAFWARWAHFAKPDLRAVHKSDGAVYLLGMGAEHTAIPHGLLLPVDMYPSGWRWHWMGYEGPIADGPYVVIGSNGPSNEPWDEP